LVSQVNVSLVVFFHRLTTRLATGLSAAFERTQPEYEEQHVEAPTSVHVSGADVKRMGYNILQPTDRQFLVDFVGGRKLLWPENIGWLAQIKEALAFGVCK
jgi:hypothetical protein